MIKPMLATLTDTPFNRDGWLFEIKWDGYRAIAELDGRKIKLYSRNFLPFNDHFPPVVEALKKQKLKAVLDGEVVVIDKKGRSHFQLLQNYQNTGQGHLVYFVFDILELNGKNLKPLPLIERKKILKKTLKKGVHIQYSDHVLNEGEKFFKAAQKMDLEGIIAKDAESAYKPGRRSIEWLKIKHHHQQEAVIAGFTQPRGGRKKFGALVLGVYKGKDLIYIGHTGTGFDDKTLAELHTLLKPLAVTKSPFKVSPKTNMPVTWVRPKIVCEVSFSEWTGEGSMRHPVYLGLRYDKKPIEVKKEIAK